MSEVFPFKNYEIREIIEIMGVLIRSHDLEEIPKDRFLTVIKQLHSEIDVRLIRNQLKEFDN